MSEHDDGTDLLGDIKYEGRPLHFIWMVDCSGSMDADHRMQSLDAAIAEAIPHVAEAARENPEAELLMRAVRFSTGAHWHVREPTPVEEFTWPPLTPRGHTDMGAAFRLVADALDEEMPRRALPPVLVLVTDGHATDDVAAGFERLQQSSWCESAVRVSVAIGSDVDAKTLDRFRDPDVPILYAHTPHALTQYIRWVSVTVTKMATETTKPQRPFVPVPARTPREDETAELTPLPDDEVIDLDPEAELTDGPRFVPPDADWGQDETMAPGIVW